LLQIRKITLADMQAIGALFGGRALAPMKRRLERR